MEDKLEIKFSTERQEVLREIAMEFFTQKGVKTNKILNEKVVSDIYIALVNSIQINDVFEFFKKNEKNIENVLKNLYDDLLNLKKINFTAKNLLTRIKSKYEYYEKSFKIRTKIQNLQFDYHKLKSSTSNFLRAREIVKIEYEYIQNNKIGDVHCIGCGTKWLKTELDYCPICDKENDLNMYLVISNFFHIVGDMKSFYKSLPEDTEKILLDNWTYIHDFFRTTTRSLVTSLWKMMIEKQGYNQYFKLIKQDKGYAISEKLFDFNAKYNTNILDNDEVLDLREAKWPNTEDFFKDLNKINFEFCKTIKFGKRITLSEFKPDMPNLEVIEAKDCHLKEIDLDPKYFQKLRRIHIDDNEIATYDSIKNLRNLPNLKVIDVHGNPIERCGELWKLDKNMENVEIRYDHRLRALDNRKVDEESDPELKSILAKINPDSESEISKVSK